MQRFLALLRGVNVGGNNMVAMPTLKTTFEEAGFTDVRTYINSGNVIFSTEEASATALQPICRQMLLDRFGLDIPVAVLAAKDLADALSCAPAWWGSTPEAKHSALFVIHPANAQAMVEEVGANREYEQVACHGQIILWSAPLKTYSRTRWSKVVATRAYASITVRNANTTRKLLQLSR